jgi:hypothetical protein
MRTHTIIRVLAAGLLAACALAVAACGGENAASGDANSAADRESDARDAQLKYARCMRDHGVEVPDPTFDRGGGVTQVGPDSDDLPRDRGKFREAEQACKKYLDAIEPPQLSEEEQQEFKEAALAHSRCMREHGIENFPDPTFGEDGRAELRLEERSGINPDDPDFKEAQKACEDTMPKPPSEESAP